MSARSSAGGAGGTRWRRSVSRVAGALLVAASVASAGVEIARIGARWEEMGPLAAGAEVPPFVARTMTGERFDNGNLRGEGKVTVLAFWATWCGACAKQMPTLAELDRRYAGRGLALYGVNTDRDGDQRAMAAAYARAKGLPFPILLDSGRTSDAFRVSLIPHIVLFDAEGRLRYVHQGTVRGATLEREIETLLAEAGD